MAKYNLISSNLVDFTTDSNFKVNDTIESAWLNAPAIIQLPAGKYNLECWGAQGGNGQYWYQTLTTLDLYNMGVPQWGYSNSSHVQGYSGPGYLTQFGLLSASAYRYIYAVFTFEPGTYSFTANIDYGSTVGVQLMAFANGTGYSLLNSTIELTFTSTTSVSFQFSCNANNAAAVWTTIYGYKQTSALNIETGGRGGYSTGILTLNEPTMLYLRAGGYGYAASSTVANTGGFNGGGSSYMTYPPDQSVYLQPAGGGGASDIRINEDSLYARVIVAGGGGGGSGLYDASSAHGGGQNSCSTYSDYVATQSQSGLRGGFGLGASGAQASSGNYIVSGGGGGGWYGGGSGGAGLSSYYAQQCGGGSGYVYTSSSVIPSSWRLNSAYYLDNASTIAGNTSFVHPDGNLEQGHTGDGYIRITYLEKIEPKPSLTQNLYIKTNSTTWSPVVATYIKTSFGWIGGEIQ